MLIFKQWAPPKGLGDFTETGQIALNTQYIESVEAIHSSGSSYFKIRTTSGQKLYVTPLTVHPQDLSEIFKIL